MKRLFERTLIVGASVSAADLNRNPVKKFLTKNGALSGAVVHAQSGAQGAHVLMNLRKSILQSSTAVIGVDLLFWDSVFGDPKESRARLRGLFNEIIRARIPVIIGNLPEIHPLQVHREELNDAIARECSRYERARVLDIESLFQKALHPDGVEFQGRRYSFLDLIPDGLHPGPVAAEIMAQEIHLGGESLMELSQSDTLKNNQGQSHVGT